MCHRQDRDYKTRKLSASDGGRGIKVSATASAGTLIHQALPNVGANEWDAVWLRGMNTSGSAVKLTVQWGGTTAPDDEIEITLPPESGLTDLIEGQVLNGGREVRAYAAVADVVVLHGVVHRFEQT
jgi:hypothetical protein